MSTERSTPSTPLVPVSARQAEGRGQTRPRTGLFSDGENPAVRLASPVSHAVELGAGQIEAANRLFNRLDQWRAAMRAAQTLSDKVPGFSEDAVILKIVATRSLFGGGMHSLMTMARHVERVLGSADPAISPPELVERLAELPAPKGQPRRRHHSFASKFAHYFIDPDRFPIYDPFTSRMVAYHLGPRNRVVDEAHRYREFVANFRRLRGLSGFKGRKRELDRYLWVAGQFQQWKAKPRSRINPELRALFESPDGEIARDIEVMTTSPDTGTAWL